MELEPTDKHLSRRTVTTAMAWSIPVIALAVATPLAAASPAILISPLTDAITDASPEDSVALAFQITDNGEPVSAGFATVTLDGTDVVEFDPNADGYSGPQLFTAAIEDGVALPIVIVKGAGSATGSVTVGGTTTSFSIPVSLAG